MAYTDIDDPTLYFSTTLWTGNGSDDRDIVVAGTGMQPDWVWIKDRDNVRDHQLFDSVRGVGKILLSNSTAAEGDDDNRLSAFNSNGFEIGTNTTVNDNSQKYVAWNWKAGTSFTNDASSTSVGSIDSAGSVSTTAGFAIISYTGTGSAETIAHGLGATPGLIITKKRNTTDSWFFWNKSFSATQYLSMDTTNAVGTASTVFGTLPTSTVYSTGGGSGTGASGHTYISYLFAEKQGYSKFGSYTGNGNADGTFIYTGFKPAMFMLKKTSATDPWLIYDNKRSPINQVQANLQANSTNAEVTNTVYLDFLSNGVKFRNTDNDGNLSGGTYIYMAFASNPFTTSTGVPTTAR